MPSQTRLAALEEHVRRAGLEWDAERYLRALRWAVVFTSASDDVDIDSSGTVHVTPNAGEVRRDAVGIAGLPCSLRGSQLGASRVGAMDGESGRDDVDHDGEFGVQVRFRIASFGHP